GRRSPAAHERDDLTAQAGAAAAAQPDLPGPLDRRPLPALARGRVLLRDAALPRPRPARLDARPAGRRRDGDRALRFSPRRFWGQAGEHGVTWVSAGPTLHQMILDQPGTAPGTLRFTRSCSSALSPR